MDGFYDMIASNQYLLDRLDFLRAHFFPKDANTKDKFEKSQYKITLDNVYTISSTLHDKGQSFILPFKMFKDLLDISNRFETEEDALDYIEKFEKRTK